MSSERRDRSGLPLLDGYTIEEIIDTGGFSRVYRARQHGLDRHVAVKVLNSSFEDERQQRTFERECKVMGQLSTHQNIVTVFASAITSDGHPSIIMELYEGTYRADEQLPIPEVVDVGAKVADALQAIHERGIVHRDIKPHNIFISAHGQPAVGDFGISSIESERTVTGGTGFSINYAPPEVFEDCGAGAPGDIYSLGATLYQLASGEVPFPHNGDPVDRMRSTIHKIITAPPPSLRRSDAPDDLDRLLRRCMAKDPLDRPGSADDVAQELRRIQSKIGVPQRTPSRMPTDRPAHTPAQDETVERRSTQTDTVTVARDRARPTDHLDDEASSRSDPHDHGRRRWILGAAAIGALAVIAAGFATLGENNEGEGVDAPRTTTTASPVRDFVVLAAPLDLEVERLGDSAAYEIRWSEPQDGVAFQIHLLGTTENRFTDEVSYTWTFDEMVDTPCFEVRTVNAGRTRISQAAAGPVCAST